MPGDAHMFPVILLGVLRMTFKPEQLLGNPQSHTLLCHTTSSQILLHPDDLTWCLGSF